MFFVGFVFFLACALYTIWKGKTSFTRRQWLFFGLKLVGIFIIFEVVSFVFLAMALVWNIFSPAAAEHYSCILLLSAIVLWGLQFASVGINTQFFLIMRFHENFNQDNYQTIQSAVKNVRPVAPLVLRAALSLCAALIYYGIWLDPFHLQ
ncbi:hypothetical protein ACV6RK_004090 [Cronobacter malonaticus]|uniref:hypothetical protein n=1 Tax=Cronobacter malonaticus TaxID=413503 RepID=UPI000519225C|nr:hypothetical protein [Cronobacter malonaticus]EGT4374128.1 hypothetical protein [Cronobacter malonaticus]ELY5941322.1 hypothetical protein [Cronobacter malonaticus]ELY6230975.1 hypothetical protein [Cronobacter malonaticus]MDI6469659.1 hypothetical protein [Cronobacter malonaticus]MDK1177414.1 hypothetical protein [Cronobacter malonaticus]